MVASIKKQLRSPMGGDDSSSIEQLNERLRASAGRVSSSSRTNFKPTSSEQSSDVDSHMGSRCKSKSRRRQQQTEPRLCCHAPPRRLNLVGLSCLILKLLQAATIMRPCHALKVTVSIPELVKLNDAFWLNCTHNSQARAAPSQLMGGGGGGGGGQSQASNHSQMTRAHDLANHQQIYSIKWYKDEEEFYSFLPGGDPRVSYYETKGVQPDVSTRVLFVRLCELRLVQLLGVSSECVQRMCLMIYDDLSELQGVGRAQAPCLASLMGLKSRGQPTSRSGVKRARCVLFPRARARCNHAACRCAHASFIPCAHID